MSKCNCKTSSINPTESNSETKPSSTTNFIKYTLKVVGFLISIILLPIINIVIIKFLFQTIVLNKKVDLKELIQYYLKDKKRKSYKDDEDDDEEDLLELNEDEVEMLNVEEIK